MSLGRREFLQALGAAALYNPCAFAQPSQSLYDVKPFGNASLLHITDTHAQLNPVYFREPLGAIDVTGDLARAKGPLSGPMAYACRAQNFEKLAHVYGKMGGFAHLTTLIRQLRGVRPNSLLLDGGDMWQGSAASLWTAGQDMVQIGLVLGVDIMTLHWEFTYGADRVKSLIQNELKGRIEVLAQNIRTSDFEDPVFPASTLREINGVAVGIIGQAFPYTPIAHPKEFVKGLTFGIREEGIAKEVEQLRRQGAQVCILLSHNGFQVDMKLAARVSGLDFILGGHTHDALPKAIPVKNAGGTTWVTNGGCSGKFVGILDLDVRRGRLQDFRYQLAPVFADLIPADPSMSSLIAQTRAPFEKELIKPVAVASSLLYRRGTFNGSWDQMILDALIQECDAEAAFSPGFRWGNTLLPGDLITFEEVLNQTAITYPQVTLNYFRGSEIKDILEDVADNLFNPDPYYQQGGDMVRTGGISYTCRPWQPMGKRIEDIRLNGKRIHPDQRIKVAGWASVREGAIHSESEPVWLPVCRYLNPPNLEEI